MGHISKVNMSLIMKVELLKSLTDRKEFSN